MTGQLVSRAHSGYVRATNIASGHHSSQKANCAANAGVQPSELSCIPAQPFSRTRPFAKFGAWGECVSVVRAGTEWRLICWMALHCHVATDEQRLWELCQRANPECFSEYRIARLWQPSYFIPAGDVVFEAVKNPTQIPDQPPQGVVLRHLEAMDAFPGATYYFLRPVFTSRPYPRLYTAVELRQEAQNDRAAIESAAWVHGWWIRGADWIAKQSMESTRWGLRATTRVLDGIDYCFSSPERRVVVRMIREASRQRANPIGDNVRRRSAGATMAADVRSLRRAARRLGSRFAIDPVLCFEVASRPGELWFEAHWYQGQDGRMYVHY